MDIKCICQDEDKDEYEYEDDDDDRSKSNKTKTVKHLRWRAQQSLPQGQATIGVFFSKESRSGSSYEP